MLPKVAVLMSTYNGAHYLRKQIDTILAQQDVQVELYIRDDGSKDQTIKIIRQYMNRHNNIHFMRGKQAGVGISFMNLLFKTTGADYYAFADQDDIWYGKKLFSAISMKE